MSQPARALQPRIEIIDALRGSALMAILLLHSVEHFDFLRYPQSPPEWLKVLDLQVRDTAFFLFAGKAYALFAMMFGLSFLILLDRAAQRGENFRWRFLWRLAVLGILGYLHSLVYCGDILSMLAVLGVPLVVFYGLSNRVLCVVSALLLLQLPLLWQFAHVLFDSGYVPPASHSGQYYREIYPAFSEQGFLAVCQANAVNGQLGKWWWMIDNGRCYQMLGLFAWGLMLGRLRVFENPATLARFAKRSLLAGTVVFAIFYYCQLNVETWFPKGPGRRVALNLAKSYTQLGHMVVWASGFALLYQFTKVRSVLRLLMPYGRMSLTCYVTQALFWVPMYYNFGLGLYRQWGQFYSILAGAGFFVVQLSLVHWWLKRFHYGPLEWVWRSATLFSFNQPFRKKSVIPAPSPAAAASV